MYASRFFTTSDFQSTHFFFELNPNWWSRFYEYPWAGQFAEAGDVCLDAACGVSHPLKFFLLDKCKEVYANDIDRRIKSKDAILKEIQENYGENTSLDSKYFTDIKYSTNSITNLSYADDFFDKVYCISVLEHLTDHFNQHKAPAFAKVDNFWGLFFQKNLYKTLKEFNRVLKPGGLLVVTFDFPIINLGYMNEIVSKTGFSFVEKPDFNKPSNAVYSKDLDLYCFRAVLRK